MSYDAVDYSNFGEFFVVAGTTMVPKLYDDETFKCVVDLENLSQSE